MSTARHRAPRRLRTAVIAIVLVLAAAGGAAYFLLLRGGDGSGVAAHVEVSEETPEFAFEFRKAKVIPSTGKKRKLDEEVATDAATAATDVLSQFYRTAYLDPANWRAGEYDSAWAFFDPAAARAARRDVEALTLGSGGGGFQQVLPTTSKLQVRVLMDERQRPVTIVGIVTFRAEASGATGKTPILSEGQYFLAPGEDGWWIIAYDVARDEGDGGGEDGA